MNKYFNLFIDYIRFDIGWWPFIFAVIMGSKVMGFHVPMADLASYVALAIASIVYFRHGPDFDRLSAVFLLYIPIALVLAAPNPVFHSWPRYGLFAILYIAVSPFVTSDYAIQFRQSVFKATIIICIAISAISFLCYFLGINMMRSVWDGSEYNYHEQINGTFGGITAHSMLLGPISGIAILACGYLAMKYNKAYWILAVMCAGSMLFSASRASLMSTICGFIVLFYFSAKKIGKNMRRLLLIFFALIVTYPLWDNAMAGITAKNEGSILSGVNTGTRTPKWNLRLEEWETSPIYGVGFCAVSEKDGIGYNGMIEPGSSWLAVLSMTGAVGFVLFGMMYYRAAKNSLRFRTAEGALTGAVLALVGVHMLAEGHIFSGGSYLCFLVWLAIGCATDYEPDEVREEEEQ